MSTPDSAQKESISLSSSGASVSEASLSVALPLLSTECGGFKVHQVAPVAIEAGLAFLDDPRRKTVKGLRVVLTAENGSSALDALHASLLKLPDTESKGRVIVSQCALPDVSKAGTPCACIVNPCNWRLLGMGGRTNVLVYQAAGKYLQKASLRERKRAFVAEPFAVKLPPESPLRAQGGVETVVQVLGPNIDPRFPESLDKKPDEALRLLRLAYDRALACFWELSTRSVSNGCTAAAAIELTDAEAEESGPASAGSKKRLAVETDVREGSSTGHWTSTKESKRVASETASEQRESSDTRALAARRFAAYRREAPGPLPVAGGMSNWKNVLFRFLRASRAAHVQDEIYFEDDECVVAYDGYPKARFHLLLIPKTAVFDVKRPSSLRREHLMALRRLHAKGAAIAHALSDQGAERVRCGYHAIPSLEPLHLHIISEDFDSPRMTKKKHWNSFTTDFFLSTSWVEHQLERAGKLDLDKRRLETLAAQALRCFRCERQVPNMAVLKAHIRTCAASFPDA